MRTEEHPVGFKKYILLTAFGYRLRLHVWRGGGNESRHNHRWWFISVPLFGRFEEIRYQEVAGNHYLKISVYDEGGQRDTERIYCQLDETGLEALRVHTRYPFLPYHCPEGAIHSLVPRRSGIHASLVLSGTLRRQTSEIWRIAGKLDVQLNTEHPTQNHPILP
jgi:hypothetical protein